MKRKCFQYWYYIYIYTYIYIYFNIHKEGFKKHFCLPYIREKPYRHPTEVAHLHDIVPDKKMVLSLYEIEYVV